MPDIVVSGAGVVGASMALALANDGWQVQLVERNAPAWKPSRAGFDLRVSALSQGSRRFLLALGIPEETLGHPWHRLHAEAEEASEFVDFNSEDVGTGSEPLGSISENGRVVEALWQLALAHSNIEVAVGEPLRWSSDGISIGERRVHADLLVGADGGSSAIRAATGVERFELAPGQRALVTVVAAREAEGRGASVAWQRFLETGPLALLPLGPHSDHRTLHSIVWSGPEKMIASLQAAEEPGFVERLQRAVGSTWGELEVLDQRVSFPLSQSIAKRFVAAPGVALIGDAAHVVHPLAGQGANMGLRDVRLLAEVLRTARAARCRPNDPAFLRDYERRAAVENLVLTAGIAGQQTLWGAASGIGWLRRQGLAWLRTEADARRAALGLAER